MWKLKHDVKRHVIMTLMLFDTTFLTIFTSVLNDVLDLWDAFTFMQGLWC